VVANRDLSLLAAERTGVVHQSPQAILLRSGKAVWSESHHGITAASLDTAVGEHT
jgi:bacillithiol system protein YtxJ